MAFTLEQKLAYYRANKHLRNKYQRQWHANKRRRAEIQAAKHILLAAHRLRAIGVTPSKIEIYREDSWQR